jgi:dihydrolipoamide dehydrogenase
MAGTYSRSAETVVVGGGPAGYMAAIRLGQLGRPVTLVEKDALGGECLNRGCIPSKALIHASVLYDEVRSQGAEIGISAGETLRFDMARTQAWKKAVVEKERQGVSALLRSAGATVLLGTGRFSGPKSLLYTAADGGQERVDFLHAIIATGAIPISLPGFEPDGQKVLTAYDVLDLERLPSSMLVLGGGVSGCELGEFLSQVGVAVTIVEMLPQLLPGMDPELAREITRRLEAHGVRVHTGARAAALDRSGEGVRLTVEKEGRRGELAADRLFMTIGKRAATDELGLEDAGVARDPRTGFIGVNDRQETNVAGIYAAGDCCRPPMLAHKSYREGVVAAEAIAGLPTRFQFQCIPSVVFTTPEIASVGQSVEEAEKAGHRPRAVRFPYAALGRAHASHVPDGWVKLVADEASGVVLGFHAVGADVGNLVAEMAFAIEMGATVRDLALTIHPHPTFSELIQEVALLWLGEPMHVARRAEPRRS